MNIELLAAAALDNLLSEVVFVGGATTPTAAGHLIPLVDVGMSIRSTGEHVLERERREHPPGYDENPDAPGDP